MGTREKLSAMPEKTIHIYYVVNAFLPNERAHGIQIVNTCSAMSQEEEVSLYLCTPRYKSASGTVFNHYQVPKSFVHKSIWNINPPFGTLGFYLRTLTFFVSINFFLFLKKIQHAFKREKMVVYVRGEAVLPLFWWSYFVPVFFESHQIRGFERAYAFALRRVTAVIVITERLKQKMINEYDVLEKRLLVARDAVDTKRFTTASCSMEVREKYGLSNDKKIILYVGSLGKEKGVLTVLESVRMIDQPVQVVFAGGRPEQILSLQQQYNHDNISFLGQVSHSDVPKLMQCADFLVQPESSADTYSKYFTSPMKLFEYIAAGRPIAASDVPSLREVLGEEDAFFFEADNPASLAEVLNKNYDNTVAKNRMMSQLRKLAEDTTWQKRGALIVRFIKSM